MKIVLAHNRYRVRGGEEAVFDFERRLLRENGHTVAEYEEDNRSIDSLHPALLAVRTVWSRESRQKLAALIEEYEPDVVHFHNTFPLISPSAYHTCRSLGVPVVQTLSNYRLLCPAATFLRDRRQCEACLGKKLAWPAVVHGCYRQSRAQTAVISTMLAVHRALGTWSEGVDVYIALSDFARQKYVAGGLPPDKIVVKPNCVFPDPGHGGRRQPFAVFAGRLSEEKGLDILLEAWRGVRHWPLTIVGDGPMRGELEAMVLEFGLQDVVDFAGSLSHSRVLSLMQKASIMVFPSRWYEASPMVIVEALACGLPVVASRLGSIPEFVTDGSTGLLFEAGNALDLAAKVSRLWECQEERIVFGDRARREYENRFTARRYMDRLNEIYHQATNPGSR